MDWLRQIPLGQYVDGAESWLRRLDPRLKLAWSLVFLLTPVLAGPLASRPGVRSAADHPVQRSAAAPLVAILAAADPALHRCGVAFPAAAGGGSPIPSESA